MTWNRTTVLLAALLLGAGIATAGAEDLRITSTVTVPKGAPTTSTQYITADRILTSDGRNDTIVDVAAGKIVSIDHQKKTWYEATFAEMQRHFGALDEMLKSNPMMANMFGDVTAVTLTPSEATREIAGYTCRKYELSMGSMFRGEMWVTSELEFPIEYYEARKLMYAMMGPIATRFERMIDKMKEVDGFALATTIDTKVMGFNASSTSEATEVIIGPVDPSVFNGPPSTYKKKKSPFESD